MYCYGDSDQEAADGEICVLVQVAQTIEVRGHEAANQPKKAAEFPDFLKGSAAQSATMAGGCFRGPWKWCTAEVCEVDARTGRCQLAANIAASFQGNSAPPARKAWTFMRRLNATTALMQVVALEDLGQSSDLRKWCMMGSSRAAVFGSSCLHLQRICSSRPSILV